MFPSGFGQSVCSSTNSPSNYKHFWSVRKCGQSPLNKSLNKAMFYSTQYFRTRILQGILWKQ